MISAKYSAAALLLSVVGAAAANAQTNTQPWVELEAVSVMAGLGGQGGDGQLHLPNLGTNCIWPFTVTGYGAGIQVNVSKMSASGPVNNLTRLDDFPGSYAATQSQATALVGRGAMSLKNKANNVSMDLTAQTAGIGLGVSAQGLTIDMPVVVNAPRVYVLQFGFDKTWVNADSRKTLNELVDAWKCRFVTIDVAGHTDTVGKEADNLNLSELRANAVRNYLVGAGVAPSRVTTHIVGERDLQVLTANNVRLRNNRVAVVTIAPMAPPK